MIGYAVIIGFVAVSLAMLMCFWRMATGPTLMDRVLAADTMVINTIALIILYGIHANTRLYFESALLMSMFSFISTVAYCRFVMRGNVIE